MSSKIKTQEGYKKKIGKYLISFCSTQYYGKSLHGEMRVGFDQSNNKLFIFRINPLPLSNSMKNFLKLQLTYSQLKQYSRVVYEDISSSSSNYTVLEFFPKTFQSEIQNFRKNKKYFDQMIEKFLKTYSFFYNMRLSHGNLIPSNIGITFDSRVKLMDFQISPQQSTQEGFKKDFQDFRTFISRVLQKDDGNFPLRFQSFNSKQTSRWEHLMSLWHITSPLQPIYISRKSYVENIVTGLYKLQASLQQIFEGFQQKQNTPQKDQEEELKQKEKEGKERSIINPFLQSQQEKLNDLKMSIRLLQLNYLSQSSQPKLLKQKQNLQSIIGPLTNYDIDYFNSVIIGAISDFQFYSLDSSRRLFLICCLIPSINHQYVFDEIITEFKNTQQNSKRNLLLGDALYAKFRTTIFKQLLKLPKQNNFL